MNQGRGSIASGHGHLLVAERDGSLRGLAAAVADVRMLPAYYALVGAIGLLQVGYVVPIWRLLRRKGKPQTARGMMLPPGSTAFLNVVPRSGHL